MVNHLKENLHDVISGKIQVRFGSIIQAAANYIGDGSQAGSDVERTKSYKQQEAKRLIEFISDQSLWILDIDFSKYVSEGAEQKVFLSDADHVLKLNDGIYYSSWQDYFYNLLLHNFFFEDTAYELIGFTRDNDVLYAVVKQNFVEVTETTELHKVKAFLTDNGFENTRNHDYYNPRLGIILEDLHDENVLTADEVLYFIDTVFYTTSVFWKDI